MNLKELYLEDYSNFHDIGALIARYPKLKSLDYNSSSGVPSEKTTVIIHQYYTTHNSQKLKQLIDERLPELGETKI
uniref:CSON009277 protein n=1 Tax=Culicoides sonorensis TaxID=179676 RepID=A0A336MY19_CULSO